MLFPIATGRSRYGAGDLLAVPARRASIPNIDPRFKAAPKSNIAARDTEAVQAQLESVIREYPDQWLWIHRRWKTRPAGSPSLYEAAPAQKN